MEKHMVRSKTSLDQFEMVAGMHEHFGIPLQQTPGFLDPDTMRFRLEFLEEELDEIMIANFEENLEELADGLVDLVIVALGTAAMMGLPFNDLFLEVHKANMNKVRVDHPSESKRGSGFDLKKPDGWQKPNLGKYLK
jgi:predicted HAD superfamily Cof-like phosphohydrolase